MLFYNHSANRLRFRNFSPNQYRPKIPKMHTTVKAPTKLVPLATPRFRYKGPDHKMAAKATVDLAKSFMANRLAECLGYATAM